MKMILKLALFFCLAHSTVICHSAKSTEVDETETFAFSNYHAKINFRNEDNTVFLEESSFGFVNKLAVKSALGNYEIFYSGLVDTFYKRTDGSINCKQFDLKEDSSYMEDEHLDSIGFINRYDKQFKIGPSAILSIFKEDHDNWIKKEESDSVRGIANSVVYHYNNKVSYFGLEELKLDLTFKRANDVNNKTSLVPLKISIAGNRGEKKVAFIFDYFDYKVVDFDDLAASGYQVAPSVGCPELSGFFTEKKPNFAIEDRMEIEFDDLGLFGTVKRERYHLDRTEKIARFEQSDGLQVLDEKNQILYHTNSEKDCEIELFSSDQNFEEAKNNFFKNLNLFLDLDIASFTFIGEEVRNGYLMRKFQRISPKPGKGSEQKTLIFKGESLDMLISETFDSRNVRTKMKILDVINIRRIDYDEEYRTLFTAPSCLSKNEFQHIHLYSLPIDEDPHLEDKLAYLSKHKEDFVLSQLLQRLRDDSRLDLNAFSTSSLERQTNQFVVNSLVLNVENYLQNYDEITNFDIGKQPLNLNVRECAWQALESKKYHGFKHCHKTELQKEDECYLIVRGPQLDESKWANSGLATPSNEEDCKTYRQKKNPRSDYVFHLLAERFTNLTKKMPYSIQVEHNVKFVFNKIRFSSGFNLIDNDQSTFIQFQDNHRFKEPKLELDDKTVPRLISPLDCYLQCTKQPFCSSFSFCQYKPSRFEAMSVKCQLSDRVLIDDDGHYEKKISKANFRRGSYSAWDSVAEEKNGLVEDKNCRTFRVNFLKHFKSNENSLLATAESIRSDQVESKEQCAKSCLSFNQDVTNKEKCGKLEVCHEPDRKAKQWQCNLKPFVAENEIQLTNESCSYYKINNLIDYHQAELNEAQDHLVHSFKPIDSCAKDCTTLRDSCKEFNFCWMKTVEEQNYEAEDGYCLWAAEPNDSKARFNVSKEALNCITMVRNDHIIASELERTLSDDFLTHIYRLKVVKEHNPDELTAPALKLFLFAFGSAGILLGWLGFSYYEKKIGPAYNAERGSFFPTRRVVQLVRSEDGDEVEIRETAVRVQKSGNDDDDDGAQQNSQNPNGQISSYQNPNYLTEEGRGESTEMKRMDGDHFTDINL